MPARSSSEPTDRAPDAASDAALVERAARGDVEAFATIYDHHAPAVLALLLRMLGSEPEARDLLHDVFLEAWRAVRAYNARRASVRTWLCVRARSRALDRVGKIARAERARRALAPARTAERAAQPGRALERQLAVRRALATLDSEVRAALELTYYGGLTAAEIGAQTGVPVGTVKSRLARGLAVLAMVLQDSGGSAHGRR
jgi:RNA polymerase sigma-70 factor (ECF subfamily)